MFFRSSIANTCPRRGRYLCVCYSFMLVSSIFLFFFCSSSIANTCGGYRTGQILPYILVLRTTPLCPRSGTYAYVTVQVLPYVLALRTTPLCPRRGTYAYVTHPYPSIFHVGFCYYPSFLVSEVQSPIHARAEIPMTLVDQLKPSGLLVIPVGKHDQEVCGLSMVHYRSWWYTS